MNFCRNILSSPATKTLWKNPNPNSNFGAQTIAFDFSRVDFEKSEVILKFKRKSTDMKTIEIRLNDGENEVCVGSSSYFFWRKYTLSKTGLVVDTGGYTSTYPEIKSDNSCAIPVELKIRGGGWGSLYYKLFKNPFVKGFSACRQSGKRWNLMGFCRNILPGGSKTPFPAGYKFKTGELAKSSSATFSIPSGCIPLTLKVVANGSGSWSDPWITIKDNNDKNIFYLHPGKNNEVNYSIGTPVDLMSLYNWDFDALATVNKFTVSNNKSSWTLSIVAWLEKAGV